MDFVRRFHSLSFDHSALLNVLYDGLPSHFVCILYACVSIHILPLLFSLFGFILYEWWWCWFSQQNKRKHVFSHSKTFAKIAFLFSSFLKYFVWILTLNIWNLVGIFHTTIFDVSKHCWFDNWMAFLLSHSDSLKTFNYETKQWIQRENQLSYDMIWNDQITTFKCIVIPTEKIPLLCFMLCAHSINY